MSRPANQESAELPSSPICFAKSNINFLTGALRLLEPRGFDWFNPSRKGIWRESQVGSAEPIEVKCHDKTVSRYGENQWPCPCSILLIFVVHRLFPNHSGCEQFVRERDWCRLFRFDINR